MATLAILAYEIPWTEEPGRLQSMGLQRVRHAERACAHTHAHTHTHTHTHTMTTLERTGYLCESWILKWKEISKVVSKTKLYLKTY